jgi:serine/threonine-protein kinase
MGKRRRLKGRKGEYLVLAELTSGGISAVHLARVKDDEGNERFVIFRELLPHLSSEKESVNRFLKEAKITYQFDHPNLVPAQEVVKMQDGYFSISEFVVGDGLGFVLASALRGGHDLPVHLAVEMLAQACAGVGFVHRLADKSGNSLGLIHKNINLRNLIVLPSGRVKVVNFDIARPENRPHPSRVTAYMSPEQCVGKPLDVRTDVFSLGVVLWELLTRCHLFMREDDMETRRAVMACKVAPPGEFRPGVPENVAGVAMRALSKDPAARYADASEMGDALREAAGTPPGAAEAQEYLDSILSERFKAKLDMLEAIETNEDAEVDPSVLLPNPAVDLPPVPEEDPHGFDSEPVTQKDPGKKEKKETKQREAPPSLPPKPEKVPTPEASEAQQAEAMPPPPTGEAEKKEEKPAEDSTPPPFKPAARVRSSYQRFMSPGAIAAAVLAVVLIVILAWPSGESADEAGLDEAPTAGGPAVEESPEPAAEEQAAVADKPGLAVIEIVTDPKGCQVFLDDMRLAGKTPLENVFIPANTEYMLMVKCKGFKKESREIVARPGERLQLKIIPPPK